MVFDFGFDQIVSNFVCEIISLWQSKNCIYMDDDKQTQNGFKFRLAKHSENEMI